MKDKIVVEDFQAFSTLVIGVLGINSKPSKNNKYDYYLRLLKG